MTIKELKALKIGDTVANKDGVTYKVKTISPYWKGFLSSSELERKRDKPDGWLITVEHRVFLQFDRKELTVVR